MSKSVRQLLVGVVLLGTCGVLLTINARDSRSAASADVLEATGNLRWYRGNLHTHSLWSDGDNYLELIALWYKEHGYDFLGFTDHNVLAKTERWTEPAKNKGGLKAYKKLKDRFPDWVEERSVGDRLQVRLRRFDEVAEKIGEPGRFLLIQGEEISDRFGRYPIHLNANNIEEAIPPMRGQSVYETIQNNVNAVIAQRERTGKPMLVHLNHPNYHFAIPAEDLMRVRGENFFEVYNGHPAVQNSGDETHPSADRLWDIILTRRIAELDMPLMYGLAVDDAHSYHNIPSRSSEPGRGWIMVLADELTPAALIEAMERGRFYASCGVRLQKVEATSDGLTVEVEPEAGVEYTIEFIGTRKDYDPSHRPRLDKNGEPIHATHVYSDDIGEVFAAVKGTSASYEFTGDELYVRARITSSKKHPNPSELGEFERAWVQPHYGPAAPKRR